MRLRAFGLKLKFDKNFFGIGAIVFALGFYHINVLVNSLVSLVIGSNSIDSLLMYAVLIFVAVGFFLFYTRTSVEELIVVFFIIVALFITRFFWSDNWEYVIDIWPEMLQAVLAFIVFMRVRDVDLIENAIHKLAYVIFADAIILGLVSSGLILQGIVSVTYMAYGYNMVPAVLIFLFRALEEKKKKYYIFSIILIALILAFGSRGTLVAIAGFIAIYLFCVDRKLTKKKLFVLAAIILVVAVLTNDFLLQSLASFLSNLLPQSRTLELVLSGEIYSDSGRSAIYEGCINLIKEHSLLGNGICGERTYVFIYQPNNGVTEGIGGLYAHNFFLEVFVDFGIPIGLFISIYVLLKEIKILVFRKDLIQKIGVILFSAWFFQHMISSSFWTSPYFFAALAFAIVCGKKTRAVNIAREPVAKSDSLVGDSK